MYESGCTSLDVGCRIELYPIQSNPYPILSCKKVRMSFKETENSQLV